MPIEMPSGLPFSVDIWTPSAMKKRHHFLTHAHTDHTLGISTHYSYPIYSTRLTQTLILHHFPQLDESLFVGIEVGETLTIDDPDGSFSVTAFDANHCPGALMFLFEGDFGNILHTGDSRLTSECLLSLPEKYIGKRGKEPRCRLDYVFLDCTFGQSALNMPSKYSAVRQVINCIWKHPNAQVVYLSCDLLGQEDILISVSKTFGSKVFVDKQKSPDYFRALTMTAPQVVSEDPSSRFHVLEGFPKLCERAKIILAEAKANSHPEPLIIRPSTQWFVHDKSLLCVDGKVRERSSEAVRDPFGVWHICYSMHSSREELEWALQILAPKGVVSTTPSCRAMELSYVKKNCFPKQLSAKDPVWKLLGIKSEDFLSKDISSKVVNLSSMVEDSHESEVTESQMELIESSTDDKKPLIISPPRKKTSVTLFGRARLGIEDFVLIDEKENTIPEKDHLFCNEVLFELNSENLKETKAVIRETYSKSMVEDERNLEEKCVKSMDDFSQVRAVMQNNRKSRLGAYSRNGSSNAGFSDRFRKMYRMMNVPVPEPLPSLVELMKARKRAKRDYNLSI